MKKRKIKIILILLVLIFLTRLIFPKNESMSYDVKTCSTCGATMHATVYDDKHIWICTSCAHTYKQEEHYGGRHENNGICRACGQRYQDHHKVELIGYDGTSNGHREAFRCSCGESYLEELLLPHSGGDLRGYVITSNGHRPVYRCICGEDYPRAEEPHSGGELRGYVTTSNGHRPVYRCACGETYPRAEEPHSGGELIAYEGTSNGHRPIYRCACGEAYPGAEELHSEGELVAYEGTGNGHRPIYRCTCGEVYPRAEEPHSGGELVAYEGTSNGHRPIYQCVCGEDYARAKEPHTGESHENDGKCTVCNEKYVEHRRESQGYKHLDNRQHEKETKCKKYNLDGTYIDKCEIVEVKVSFHEGGTHENNGVCDVCKYQYETHEESTTIKRYDVKGNTHTPIYGCSLYYCPKEFPGETENHRYSRHTDNGDGTHSSSCEVCEISIKNDHNYENGTCKECGAIEIICEHAYVKIKNEKQHWEECEKCGIIKKDSKQSHNFNKHTDNGNGTHSNICEDCGYNIINEHNYENEKCKICGATKKVPECEHSYNKKSNEKQHWDECEKCGKVKEGTIQNHNFEEYKDEKNGTHSSKCTVCESRIVCEHNYENGKCTECNASKGEPQCNTHSYQLRATENQHWLECEKCGQIKIGSLEMHNFSYTDRGDGKHNKKCSCGIEFVFEHKYIDGKCKDCGSEEKECEHSYVKKTDEKQHWEECKKCGAVKTGTLKNHNFEYTDNKDGKHKVKCKDCNYEITESHSYSNGKCIKCNSVQEEKECTHNYIKKSDNNKHWEQCEKCGEIKNGTIENHNFEKHIDNGNGTHSSECTSCGYKINNEHNYENGKCKECKSTKEEKECEHSYVKKTDEKQHWEECEKCGAVKAGTLKNHTFKDYKDNKDGTHSSTCSECNYKLTENHSNDNGICKYCKASTQHGGTAKEDTTTAKEKIPYTGKSIVLFTSMII